VAAAGGGADRWRGRELLEHGPLCPDEMTLAGTKESANEGKAAAMTEITDFARLVTQDQGLCVVSTLRGDRTIQSSVVNAGVLNHPVTGRPVVGLVARGGSRKLANLRANPRATIVVRAGWEWAAAEGPAELAGPADPLPGFGMAELPALLRAVFTAAGGTHDDWETYDRVMAAEGRTAVLVDPQRLYSNG
jgi:PPOX class probable F420-dependent enzyme